MEHGVNKHDRYNSSEKGRARLRRYAAKRVRVFGERIVAPDMQTRELMALLRDERRASVNAR